MGSSHETFGASTCVHHKANVNIQCESSLKGPSVIVGLWLDIKMKNTYFSEKNIDVTNNNG